MQTAMLATLEQSNHEKFFFAELVLNVMIISHKIIMLAKKKDFLTTGYNKK